MMDRLSRTWCYVEEGRFGVNIPKGVWHTIEALEPDSVIFECKEGPFVEHEVDGILNVEKKKVKEIVKGVWAFCSFVVWPQRRTLLVHD